MKRNLQVTFPHQLLSLIHIYKVGKVVTEHIVNNKVVQEFTIGAYEK